MNDLFWEALQVQRIDLVARLTSAAPGPGEDHVVALGWIAEMTWALRQRLETYEAEPVDSPPEKGNSGGGGCTLQ